VRVEALGDMSGYHSWNWLLSDEARVAVQTHGDPGLEWTMASELRDALESRGYRRDRYDPDVLVYFHVGLRRQVEQFHRTRATRHLASLHESASFDIQATDVEHSYYELAEVRVVLVDAESKQVVWRVVMDERYWKSFAPHIPEVVTELAGHIPPPSEIVHVPVDDPWKTGLAQSEPPQE